MISFVGTGIGNFVDESVAVARGVSLFATPGENAAAVAEYTVGLILAATRGILGYNDQVKRGGEPPAQVRELGEATTVGLFGLGNIGERVARILRVAFGANVLYTTRRPRPTAEDALGVERVSVEELFERSQVVSLLAPLTPETEGLVDHRLLSRGAPGLVLVNTGPARVVVAEDLRRAIEGGQVGSAVFDGYWIEPPPSPQEDPFGLLILPDARFSITPHIAAKTPEAWRRMVDGAVANLCDAFDGR
jgi:lactate dehydrogenase-like 2-hydroxyacid dehydrogenase